MFLIHKKTLLNNKEVLLLTDKFYIIYSNKTKSVEKYSNFTHKRLLVYKDFRGYPSFRYISPSSLLYLYSSNLSSRILYCFDIRTGQLLYTKVLTSYVVCLHANRTHVFLSLDNSNINIYEAKKGTLVHIIDTTFRQNISPIYGIRNIYQMKWHKDALYYSDGDHIYKDGDTKPMFSKYVTCFDMYEESVYCATGSCITHWSLQGDLLKTFLGHVGDVSNIVVLDRHSFFSSGIDHTIRRWNIYSDIHVCCIELPTLWTPRVKHIYDNTLFVTVNNLIYKFALVTTQTLEPCTLPAVIIALILDYYQ